MAHAHRMQEYFATANREKMRRPCPRRDHGPAAKPLAQRRRREEDAASGAKLEMARCKNKLNRAGFHPFVMSSEVDTSLTIFVQARSRNPLFEIRDSSTPLGMTKMRQRSAERQRPTSPTISEE